MDEGPVHPLVQIKIEGVGRAVRIAKARLLDAARDRPVLPPLPSVGCQGAADWMLSFREIVDVVSERRPQDLSTRDSTPTSMLIVRFAMPASCRVRWNFSIRRVGECRERDVAEVRLDEAEPFLFQLDRARGSPRPRGIQVGADRILTPRRPLFSSADSRRCPASSTSSRSRRVAVRRFIVPRRFRYRRPATVKSVQH